MSARPPFWHQLFRNTGLGAVNDLNDWIKGRRHGVEQKKVVISTSRWTAASRCGVHVLPVIVSVAIIVVNIHQVYIGIDFDSSVKSETINTALLQVAAKLQELLIIASLATIVFQLIRDELLYGDGIPLGLVGAGIDFTKISYFWSPEVLGSLRSLFKGRRKYRKIQLGFFLVLAGALALLAGPSCAVLLVPRKQDWPAGGTTLYLNRTKQDFWPIEISASPLLTTMCSNSTGIRYGVCPSGGFRSLWSHYTRLDFTNFQDVIPSYANDLSGNRYYWPIESSRPVSTKVISLGVPIGDTFIIQPHMSVAVLLDELMKDWWKALLAKKHWSKRNVEDRQAATMNVLSPLVHVGCSPAISLTSSRHSMVFPTFDSSQPTLKQVENITFPDEPTDHLRFSWISLPLEFDSVTTGAVLQSPWGSDNASRLVVACSVQVRWVPAHLRTEAYTFWQGWYPKNITFEGVYPVKGSRLLDGSKESSRNAIVVDQSWLKALTPSTPMEGPGYHEWSPTTIESILNAVGLLDDFGASTELYLDLWQPRGNRSRPDLLASVIQSVFADGLARVNLEQVYDSEGSPSKWTPAGYEKEDEFDNLVVHGKDAIRNPLPTATNDIKVEFAISGLSYRNTLAQKLAMIVLFAHMVVAVSHTLWTIGRGKSSASWDSIAEMVVVAQNSQPALSELQNTAAGIKHSYTFAKKVCIRPTNPPAEDAENADHLEMFVEKQDALTDYEMDGIATSNAASTTTFQSDQHTGSDPVAVGHSSTWPTYRHSYRHGSAATIPDSTMQSNNPASEPHSPLLSPPRPAAMRATTSIRVRENYAYG